MTTILVTCLEAMQTFEVPRDHPPGMAIQCPLCGNVHPVPIPSPPPRQFSVSREIEAAAVLPPSIAPAGIEHFGPRPGRVASVIRASTFFLTLACGCAIGVMSGLAIAAATMPTEVELRSRLAESRRREGDLTRELDEQRAAYAAQTARLDRVSANFADDAKSFAARKEMLSGYLKSQAAIHMLLNDETGAVKSEIRINEGNLGEWWIPHKTFAKLGGRWLFDELGVRVPSPYR